MRNQLTPGEASPRYGSSKVAICALRTLQARLEQLESERDRAFDRSIDAHQIATKEVEDMKASYELDLKTYRVEQEVLQKKIESMSAEYSNVERKSEQYKNECNDLRKELADSLAERNELSKSLKQTKDELAFLCKENKALRHLASSRKEENTSVKHKHSQPKKSYHSNALEKNKVNAERRKQTIPDRLRSAYSDHKVPFLANVAKETFNLTASVQNALSSQCNGPGDTSKQEQLWSILKDSIETITDSVTNLMKSLSQEPSVKAYKQMEQLLSQMDAAREQLTERKRRQRHRQKQTSRQTSPESRRCYERKLRMLSILHKFKSELFGIDDKK